MEWKCRYTEGNGMGRDIVGHSHSEGMVKRLPRACNGKRYHMDTVWH